jgi:hypothetical protein
MDYNGLKDLDKKESDCDAEHGVGVGGESPRKCNYVLILAVILTFLLTQAVRFEL